MSNRKVKKNKAKKKTTNYKQLGAVGLGGTFLGALATRGMFDRKQLLNIKDCDKRIKQMKDDCAKNRKSLIKSHQEHNDGLALANEQLQQELEKFKKENKLFKQWFKISYDEDLGAKPDFTYEVQEVKFGRKRIKSKVKKIPSSLKKKCKRLKVRLTTKRGGKRVYKSIKVLKKQCSNKMKKKY